MTTTPLNIKDASGATVTVGTALTQNELLVSNLARETGGKLESIEGKLPSQGQATASASIPVVLPESQITALAPPGTIAVSNFPATQAISGNIAVTSGNIAVSNFPATQAISGNIAVTSGNIAVTNFPATQPVSAASLPLPTGAASETTLAALNTKIPAQGIAGLLPVDTLGTPGVARVQATSGAAAGIELTPTCRRVSMFATQGTWYSILGTATVTSHYIGAGERIDFDVPASTTISVLQETTAGSIRITELV